MNILNKQNSCENYEIAAYLDGDFSLAEELEFENHLAVCKTCSQSLSEQKRLLCAMNFAFSKPEHSFEIPKNFASVIVTKAESKVSGLRCPKERVKSLSYCIILFAMAIIGFGESRFQFITFGQNLLDNVFSVVYFIGHFIYDASSGLSTVLSGLSDQLFFFSDISTALLLIFFFFVLVVFSRLLILYHRT